MTCDLWPVTCNRWPAFTRRNGQALTDLPLFFYSTVCAEKTCPPYANCVHSDSGAVCVCPNCSPKGGKVCGSDGRTYKHSCQLEKHACKKSKSISIVSQGGCAGMLETIRVNNTSIELSSRQRHTNCPPQPAEPWPEIKVTLKTHKWLQLNSWAYCFSENSTLVPDLIISTAWSLTKPLNVCFDFF